MFDYICFKPKKRLSEAVVSETSFKNHDVKILFLAEFWAFALFTFAVFFVFKLLNLVKDNWDVNLSMINPI